MKIIFQNMKDANLDLREEEKIKYQAIVRKNRVYMINIVMIILRGK